MNVLSKNDRRQCSIDLAHVIICSCRRRLAEEQAEQTGLELQVAVVRPLTDCVLC
jgi:hypothetical protein